jgi:hypothetical protein
MTNNLQSYTLQCVLAVELLYGITPEDIGLNGEWVANSYADGESAIDSVIRLGDKYDLDINDQNLTMLRGTNA